MQLINKKFLIRACTGIVATAFLIYLFTMPFIIKPLYQSEAIVFAPHNDQSTQENQNFGRRDEQETDYYIQLLKSTTIADSMGESHVRIEKTRYGSVSVKVLHGDPALAADMANTIVQQGELARKNLVYPSRYQAMKQAQNLYEQKKSDLEKLQRQLDSIQRSPLFRTLGNDLNYLKLRQVFELEVAELVARKELVEHKKWESEAPIPPALIVSAAEPNADPVKPKRFLLMAAGAGTYLFLLFAWEIVKREFHHEAP